MVFLGTTKCEKRVVFFPARFMSFKLKLNKAFF